MIRPEKLLIGLVLTAVCLSILAVAICAVDGPPPQPAPVAVRPEGMGINATAAAQDYRRKSLGEVKSAIVNETPARQDTAERAVAMSITFNDASIAAHRKWLSKTDAMRKAEVKITYNDSTIEMTFEDFISRVGLKK